MLSQISAGGEIVGAAQKWCDIITLNGAEALVNYNGEYYKGIPAATVNLFGKGKAYYIGFEPDGGSMKRIMDPITDNLRIEPIAAAPDKVEVIIRPSAYENYYFVLNHSGEKVSFAPKPGWKPVLGADTLEPYGIAVFKD